MSYTLAIGPFTPFWRGPQRLLLTVENDVISDVTYQGGYNERGCAERLPRLRLEAALHLVARMSGSSSQAHTLAFCQALEALTATKTPLRAAYLRCVVAELERLATHLHTLYDSFQVLGRQQQSTTLYSLWQQSRTAMHLVSGAAALPEVCIPGGMRYNPDEQQLERLIDLLDTMMQTFYPLIDRTIDERALLARTVDVGGLSREAAEQFGVRGPLARASGLEQDARVTEPYAAYSQLDVRVITQDGGDVHARLVLLLLEALESLKIALEAAQDLPLGSAESEFPLELPPGPASAVVESPGGLLRYTLMGEDTRLAMVTIDAPRQFDRLLARTLLVGAQVDNAVLIALSTGADAARAEL